MLDNGVEYKVINKSGNTYTYKEEKLGVGREAAKRTIKENTKMTKALKKEIWDVIKKGPPPEEEEKKKK